MVPCFVNALQDLYHSRPGIILVHIPGNSEIMATSTKHSTSKTSTAKRAPGTRAKKATANNASTTRHQATTHATNSTTKKKTRTASGTKKAAAPKKAAAKKASSTAPKATAKRATSKTGSATHKRAPAKKAAAKKAATPKRAPAKKRVNKWSAEVMEHSDALDLRNDVFKLKNPKAIAESLKKSADASKRKKGTPYQSAMSMLNFYINRAGKNLPAAQHKVLEKAKTALREVYGRE